MDATQVVASPNRAQKARGPKALRAGFSTLGFVSTGAAAWVAERLWFTPPRPKISGNAKAALAQGERLTIKVEGRPIAAWRFGEGPSVLLVHGWGGFAGQFAPWIEPLQKAGFSVVTFDAFAHGESAPSPQGYRLSTFFDFAAAMRALAVELGPFRGLVAHSGGAMASGIALRAGMSFQRAVFLAPMTRPGNYATIYSDALGLGPAVTARWQEKAAARLGMRWSDFDVAGPYTVPLPPVLVIHDPDDKEVPFGDGRAVTEAWPGAELVTAPGLGHRRLLKDSALIDRAVRHLAG